MPEIAEFFGGPQDGLLLALERAPSVYFFRVLRSEPLRIYNPDMAYDKIKMPDDRKVAYRLARSIFCTSHCDCPPHGVKHFYEYQG